MPKYFAELVGTFILVLFGSMSILASGELGTGLLTVPFGFGLGFLAAYFAVGHVSGGHFNPAVSLAMLLDGRLGASDFAGYVGGQLGGALAASFVILAVTSQEIVANTGTFYATLPLGVMAELLLTAVFVLVILAVTRTSTPAVAGMVISLTLAGVHFAGIPFSGASVNPARSLAPALVGGDLSGVWVYVVFPLLGGVVAWGLWQFFRPVTAEDTEQT